METSAILSMRMMLEDYTASTGIDFNSAFISFVSSPVYTLLFDYSTELWKEGPDYLKAYFMDYLSHQESSF